MKGLAINVEQVTPDAFVTDVSDWEGDFTTAQEYVGGNVEVAPSSGRVLFLINEDGKGLRLPHNVIADAAWSLFDTYGCLASGDFLVGPVLIVGRHGGGMTDLAEETRERILTFLAEACGLDWRES